jgi:hypothetical protein
MNRNHAYIPDRSAAHQRGVALITAIIIASACTVGFLFAKAAELSERQTNILAMTFGFAAILLCAFAFNRRGH